MTTEVAILNKEAIALAADSAVTINMENGTKIYNSANKLFALSKSHPVGIMVYGNSLLSGIPWESLIKVYRSKLNNSCFPSLKNYCQDFIEFLHNNIDFFPEKDRTKAIGFTVYEKFEEIRKVIRGEVGKLFKSYSPNKKVPKAEVNEIIHTVIENFFNDLNDLEYIPEFLKDQDFLKEIENKYKKLFQEILSEVFEDLSINKKDKNKLMKIALFSLIKTNFSSLSSGIVIAGFGEEEFLPSLYCYRIDCFIEEKIKYIEEEGKSCTTEELPAIIPFAQRDMILTFVEGIDPQLEQVSIFVLHQILNSFFDDIINGITKNTTLKNEFDIKTQKEKFNMIQQDLIHKYRDKMLEFQRDAHVDPILTTVSILPKEELGAMAEALVNLTSLKRRVTTDVETVGGPTDVALISKGDGFIWLKRKHYFKPELNHDFFNKKQF